MDLIKLKNLRSSKIQQERSEYGEILSKRNPSEESQNYFEVLKAENEIYYHLSNKTPQKI